MILVAGGDSMIWGSELKDSPHGGPDGYSHSTLTALLAQQAKMDYQCCAYPGNANNAISRSVITQCEQLESPKMVVAMWTFTQRIEFRFNCIPNQTQTSDWFSINSWHIDDNFKFNSRWIDRKIIKEFANIFFKSVGDCEYYEQYAYLKEVLFLQLYLKSKNIPYLFLTTNNESFEHENYKRYQHDLDLSGIYQQIDWDHWYFFPKGDDHDQTTVPRGFYQWAVENKYIVGEHGHPLEQAHEDAAKLIKEKFDELVKKSN
jgi:hypothetical protein